MILSAAKPRSLIFKLWLCIVGVSFLSDSVADTAPAKPLSETCQPKGMLSKAKMKLDYESFWRDARNKLVSYKGWHDSFLRTARLTMNQELQNIITDCQKHCLMTAGICKGDYGQIHTNMCSEQFETTRRVWIMMIRDSSKNIVWAGNCIDVADKRVLNGDR